MNQTSSRSHSIFTIVIECAESSMEKGDHIRVGKLNLVDLAGSERQSKVSGIDTSTIRKLDALTHSLTHSLADLLTRSIVGLMILPIICSSTIFINSNTKHFHLIHITCTYRLEPPETG